MERTAKRLPGRGSKPAGPAYILRPHQPGDIGWIIHRHGVLYAEEYGLDMRFEALVARIAAAFIDNFDAAREWCWIAERAGAVVGSVLLVKETDEVAKLRLLYIEPWARGLGIGSRLVAECIRFARRRRYRKISLWTNDVLVSARRIYLVWCLSITATVFLGRSDARCQGEPSPSMGEGWVGVVAP